MGWDWYRRNISFSFRSSAVRFFSLGGYHARQAPWRAWYPPEVKTQEAKALPLSQVDHPAFLLIDRDLERGQFFPESSVYGLEEPGMLRIGIHQDHEIIGKPGIFEVGIRSTAGDLFGPLQHPIHRREIQITEERREHTALRNALLARGVQRQLQP